MSDFKEVEGTKWRFTTKRRGQHTTVPINGHVGRDYLEAVKRTRHRDPATGRMVTSRVIVETALHRLPEVRRQLATIKQERNHGRTTRGRSADAEQ